MSDRHRFVQRGLALFLVLFLAACGGGGGGTPGSDGGGSDAVDAGPGADSGADVAPSDAAADLVDDAGPTPDVVDAGPSDTTPDTASDVPPDAGPDALPDVLPDVPDGAADVSSDVPDVPPPDVPVPIGALVITEIMIAPCLATNDDGEWLEITNVGGTIVNLNGWSLSDDDGVDEHVVDHPVPLIIGPGKRVVLGATTDAGLNGGMTVDYAWGDDVRLANATDEVILSAPGGQMVDRVTWGGAGGAVAPECAALALDPAWETAEDNDDPTRWCPAESVYGWGDKGTPGRVNDPCPAVGACGNGREDAGEECDEGDANSDSEPNACRTDCRAARCGDGVEDDEEECDDGADNSDFVPDACRTDCREAWCGDGVPDEGEACDDGGDVPGDGCEPDCTTTWTCGDGQQDPDEQCDDGDDNADDVPDACRTTCTLPVCGDSVVDPMYGETCDEGGQNSDVEPDACRENCLAARCGDGVEDSGEECDDGGNESGDGCDAECRIDEPGPGRPQAHGQIVITEIMKNPVVVADDDGEWIEILNPTPFSFDLDGCVLRDGEFDEHVITADSLLIAPGQLLVLGRNADPLQNGGIAVDYVYETFFLSNGDDSVRLVCGGVVIDRVDFTDAEFPDTPGRALSLDPGSFEANANDVGSHWCDARDADALGDGNFGTPGVRNPACPAVSDCGNGTEEPGEACDDGGANADDVPNACRTDCTLPFCGDGVVDDDYGETCDDGATEDGDGCSALCLEETGATPMAAGDLVVTEIMHAPVAIAEADGEWLELKNPGPAALDLDGCELSDLSGDVHLIDAGGALLVQAGGRVVLAANGDIVANDGVVADYVYDRDELVLDELDEVLVTCGDVVIDSVVYDPGAYPNIPGHSLSLDPDREDAEANDDSAAWCAGVGVYGSYNEGTPGAPNDPCPGAAECGNGEREAGEECDFGPSNSNVLPNRCRENCTNWRCGDGVVDAGEQCDDGNDSSGDGCAPGCLDEGAQAVTAAGQLLWTELMIDPTPRADAEGQWIELRNTSGIRLDLAGCVIGDGGDGGFSLAASFEAAPGAILVFAASDDPAGDGSVVPAAVYDQALLPLADAGAVVFTCGAVEVDRVAWDAAGGWPVTPGRAMALDGLVMSQDANDLADNWCAAGTALGGGEGFGSPGAANERCPGTCGNGVQEWDEGCDQGVLNSDERADRCRTDCTAPHCGDGVRDSGEGCDDGNDDPGDGCAPDCTTEVATECGNSVTEVGEECDDGDLNSDVLPDRCRENCRNPYCGDGVTDGGEDCDDGDTLPGDGCSPLCVWDYEPQMPDAHGQAFVTEIMPSPLAGAEWFEVLNDHPWPLDFDGCTFGDGVGRSFAVDGPLIVEPGQWLVFAAGADVAGDGSIEADFVYDVAAYALGEVDTLRITCTDVLIDRVRWSAAEFPVGVGAASSLDPFAYSATANDAPGNWCLASDPYGDGAGDGTPGALNSDCGLDAVCGDGVEDPGEQCDDGAFNSSTAPDACRGDCRLAYCGDGVVDSGESCDDENDVDGDGCSALCVSEIVCGDGVEEPGEACDDGDDNSDVLPDACRTDCTLARCGDGVEDTGEACDDGGDAANDGCSPLCEYEATPEPVSAAGQVVITEIFPDPAVIGDNQGEWFEVTSGDLGVYDLAGCVFLAGDGDVVPIVESLRVGPGQYRLFAASADPAGDGSVVVDHVYAFLELSFSNAGDSLELSCGDETIDVVTWSPGDWPVVTGRALSLDPSATSALANDAPGAWCEGAVPYGAGAANFGTPGAANPTCGYDAICGNGLEEPGEACDDGDANSDDRPDACRLDCVDPYCGDGVLDDAEDCDDGGNEAGDGCGPTCLQEGTCGNGVEEPGEECDDGPLNSNELADRCRLDCRDPGCGDRVVDTGEQCDDGDREDGDGCSAVCAWEALSAPAAFGEVVFTELMIDPLGMDDAAGEWFELTNLSGRVVELDGCRIESGGEAGFLIFGPLAVYHGEALVFAASGDPAGNGDVLVDYVFSGLEVALGESADTLALTCDDVAIDDVSWDVAFDWIITPGRALGLSPDATNADDNDLPTSWCDATDPFGPAGEDYGTPGMPNPDCL